jgi:hypothetical protein
MIQLILAAFQNGTSRKCIENFGHKMMQAEHVQGGGMD